MGLGMEPRGYEGEMRKEGPAAHAWDRQLVAGPTCAHTIPAAGLSTRVLFSELLKPDTRLRHL